MTQRKYFGTDGVRGRVGEKLITPEFVLKLGWAAGSVLAQAQHGKVLIGKDTRISGYLFESALEAGLSAAGVDIHLVGPIPTPAIAYLTRTLRAQAGIMISASHNPYHDNGIKFFSAEGKKLPDEIELAIEEQLDKPLVTVESTKLGKAARINDAHGRYVEFCKNTVPHSLNLRGMKVVLDCANGATYHVAPDVFRELGAEVIEYAVKPNGLNINHDCGSTHPQHVAKLVFEKQADLGIAFDGDGDRVIMVDHTGAILDGDDLLYLIALAGVSSKRIQGGVVGTVMSNLGLEQAIKRLNLGFVRTKVGDRYVIEELENKQWQLGGETSGHIIWLDATTTGDGIIAALQVLAAMNQLGRNLHELTQGMQKYPQVIVNVHIASPQMAVTQPQMRKAITEAEKELAEKGRILVRPSGTEPVLRIMVEGENEKSVNQIAQRLAEVAKSLTV